MAKRALLLWANVFQLKQQVFFSLVTLTKVLNKSVIQKIQRKARMIIKLKEIKTHCRIEICFLKKCSALESFLVVFNFQ